MQIKFVGGKPINLQPELPKVVGGVTKRTVGGLMWLLSRGPAAGKETNSFCFSSLPQLPD